MNLSKNYYSILGVDPQSDEKSIKKNYYKENILEIITLEY